MTQKLYLNDTYQFHFEGWIQAVGEDEKGVYVILDRSAFYPQGGGQPSDQGYIKFNNLDIKVVRVLAVEDEIRHYVLASPDQILVGSLVHGVVDRERRMLNARYHTAAHLLGNSVEKLNPRQKAVKGHSFPGEAYVVFQGGELVDAVTLQETINDAIAKNDQTKVFEIDPESFEQQFYALPYKIPRDKIFRVMQIGDLLPVPCGGTHVASLREIGGVTVNKINVKNNLLRITYGVI